jgi:hypothetical protein
MKFAVMVKKMVHYAPLSYIAPALAQTQPRAKPVQRLMPILTGPLLTPTEPPVRTPLGVTVTVPLAVGRIGVPSAPQLGSVKRLMQTIRKRIISVLLTLAEFRQGMPIIRR